MHRKYIAWSLIRRINQRYFSQLPASSDVKFIDVAYPERVPLEFWKQILWVATDLKKAASENNKRSFKFLETKHITLLFVRPHGRFQLAFTLACNMLGARETLYYDGNFENHPNPADSRKALSMLTDMIVVHGLHHDVLMKLTKGSRIPVFPASCNVYCLVKGLSDLMTFQEKFNRLRGLTLAWIGPASSIFNSYLLLCSRFGINIRYSCICSFGRGGMSPVHRFPSRDLEDNDAGSRTEFRVVSEAIRGAHVIATSVHPEESNRITLNLLELADPDWLFLHNLPRGPIEVSDEVFNHERNMTWQTSENYLYVAMAVILISLSKYKPKMPMPNFDGIINKKVHPVPLPHPND